MALMNKNIWMGFYLICLLWLLSLSISSYSTYKGIYNEFVSQQVALTTMSRNSLVSTFKQYEVLLNIVASHVLKNGKLTKTEDIKSIMQAATELDSSVSGFGVFKLDGTILVSVPDSPVAYDSSLIEQKESQSTFLATTKAQGMVIGRTYFSEPLQSIIIPFRLTVRDSKGKARFIVSIAVSIDKGFKFFINNADQSGFHDTYLYREKDRYFQLAPMDRISDTNIYQYQIPQTDIDQALDKLAKLTEIPFAELKDKQIVFTNENLYTVRQSLDASVYIKDYSLWLVTEIKLSNIHSAFIDKVKTLILVHILSIILIFFLFKNIARSEKKKATELAFQANHDYLTELKNRYYFDQYFAKVDRNIKFSLIYLDIDHFKTVNDSYGHAVGDQLLKKVALKIKTIAQQNDLLIRSSSDEFILVCFHKNKQQTSDTCNKLLSSLHKPFLINDSEITLSASIGVSLYPQDSDNPENIKRNADLAINSAKKQRNSAVFFDDNLLNDYLYKCTVEGELKKAISNHEMHMVYQPQVSSDGTILGVEALIRWENEKLGIMPPDQFIPIAESMGAMDAIGVFVIERSLSDMIRLQKKTDKQYSVSINVSVKQFKNPDFFDKLITLVNKYNFPAELLILEITESVLIDDIDAMQQLMVKLKEHHIRISLDDFGTGYSSLSLLNKLPIDELKIDKSFVDRVSDDEETRFMISSMITIAKRKNMKTVAEGVETQEMLLTLQTLGCDIYQGYYFSKPIDKYQLEFLLRDKHH